MFPNGGNAVASFTCINNFPAYNDDRKSHMLANLDILDVVNSGDQDPAFVCGGARGRGRGALRRTVGPRVAGQPPAVPSQSAAPFKVRGRGGGDRLGHCRRFGGCGMLLPTGRTPG